MRSIEVINLDFSYNSIPFFKGVNLTVDRSEMVGLIGPNGCGKTTLINLIRGFLSPDKGKILIAGKELRKISRLEMGKLVSLVPQESKTSFNFTAYQIVAMGRYPHHRFSPSHDKDEHHIIMQALELTDSAQFAQKYFWNLSGGEKQRVILARAMAQQAKIILLDEPTSSLDLKQGYNLYRVAQRLNESAKVTIVAATHDIHLVSEFSHRLVMMKEGNIVGVGPPGQLFERIPLEKLFDLKTDRGGKIEKINY